MNTNATDRQKRTGQPTRIDTNNRLTAELIRSETGEIYPPPQYRLDGRAYDSIEALPVKGGR